MVLYFYEGKELTAIAKEIGESFGTPVIIYIGLGESPQRIGAKPPAGGIV